MFRYKCKQKCKHLLCSRCYILIYICWFFINLTSTTINADEYTKNVNKNMVFLCVRVQFSMSYYVLPSQHFDPFLLDNVYCSIITMYHNILITAYLSNTAYNVKFSERKKINLNVFFPLSNALYQLLFFKNSHLIGEWEQSFGGGTTLVPLTRTSSGHVATSRVYARVIFKDSIDPQPFFVNQYF